LTISNPDRIWFSPRRNGKAKVQYRLSETKIDALLTQCESNSIFATKLGPENLAFTTDRKAIDSLPDLHKALILGLYEKNLVRKDSATPD
jgi:hypothetical protein